MVIKMTQRRDERVHYIMAWCEEQEDNVVVDAMMFTCRLYINTEEEEMEYNKPTYWRAIRSLGMGYCPHLPVWKKGWKPKK